MFRLPQRSLSSQSLGKYWQLNQNNRKNRTIVQSFSNLNYQYIKSSPNKQHSEKNILGQWQTEPGLVAFYDIWPWNGAALFLQPCLHEISKHITTEGNIQTTDQKQYVLVCRADCEVHLATLMTSQQPTTTTQLFSDNSPTTGYGALLARQSLLYALHRAPASNASWKAKDSAVHEAWWAEPAYLLLSQVGTAYR